MVPQCFGNIVFQQCFLNQNVFDANLGLSVFAFIFSIIYLDFSKSF